MNPVALADDITAIVNGKPKVLNAFQRWMMCGRKIAYSNLSEANDTAARLNQLIYQCPLCHAWHTTNKKWGPNPVHRPHQISAAECAADGA